MKNIYNNNKLLIKIYINFIFCLELISTDCGLPALPYNAQISPNQVKHNYDEGDSVEYHCELDGLKLVGPPTRMCLKDRWVGSLPRCVEEVDPKIISNIGVAQNDENNTSFENRTFVYFGEYKPNECFHSKQLTRPHIWGIHLTRAEPHISYFEIEVSNYFSKLTSTEAMDVITSVKINDVRECETQMMKYSINAFRLNVTCSLQFNINTEEEDWANDKTELIELEIDSNELTVCELNIYKTSHRVHHWCGSGDVVPHSKRIFIRHNSKYEGNSHYRYVCDNGFELEGNKDVRCGVDNQWLDEFPVCKATVICPFEPLNNGTLRYFVHSYHSEGRVRAVVGTVVYYFCEEIKNELSLMIGDSVRVCETDGEWSGVAPICIHDYELYDYLEHFQEINDNQKIIDSFEPFNDMLTSNEKEELLCGIPAMPPMGKPITQPKNKRLNKHADLRSSYPNGTVISYQCELANVMVSGDMVERTCANGTWIGNVSKCEISFGNKLELNSITVSHWDQHGELAIENIDEINSTNLQIVNDNFVFRFDPSKVGQCYTFTIDKKKRLTLRLNETADISYFQVMLYPGGFFNIRHVMDPQVLAVSPLSAKANEKPCLLTSVWDYNHSKIGTYFHFSCDLDEQTSNDQHGDFTEIILDINPDKFNRSFKSKQILLCSLEVFYGKNECGTPDIPLHGSVENKALAQIWTYSCDRDYEIVGPTSVRCGTNGRWMSHFPTCRKKEGCPLAQNKQSEGLLIDYKNLMAVNGKDVAVIDSVVNFSCDQSSTTKTLLIGSSIRFCNLLNHYRWSGSEPFCLDPRVLTESKVENKFNSIILPVVLIVIGFVLFVSVVLFVTFWRRRAARNANNNNIESPYSL